MELFKKKDKHRIFNFKSKKNSKRKKKVENIKGFKFVEVVVIVIVTGILCSIATGAIFYYHYSNYNFGYDKISNNKNVNKFLQVYATILNEYYEDIDEPELIDSAINGLFTYLGDDYSEELTQEDTEALLEQLSGEYEGIGVEITTDKLIYTFFADSPSEKEKKKKNDKIIKVNDEDMTQQDSSYIASYIKSCEDDKITITVLRNNEEKTFEVTKDKLYIPSVSKEIKEINNHKIGYLYISTFSNTTANQFRSALENMENDGIESLIIDVRNNAGGYLVAAKDIASMFLEKGKIIYSLKDKSGTTEYKDTTLEARKYNVIVLTNEYSASASEILASALKESYGAKIVGKTSYGKGKVQQTLSFSDGSMAKYTTAKWLTPSGECIDQKGITPDYDVDLEIDETQQNIIDTQLNKAMELLVQ